MVAGERKTKQEEHDAQQHRVPLAEIRHVHQRVGTAQSPYRSAHSSKNAPTEEQRVEHSGAPPVEPFPLFDRAIQHCAIPALPYRNPAKLGAGRPSLRGRSCGYPVIDAEHHQRRDHRRIPEHPVPGEMISVPAVERWRDVHCSVHERRVERDRERKEPQRNISQREGEGERIERAGRQPGQNRAPQSASCNCGSAEGKRRSP